MSQIGQLFLSIHKTDFGISETGKDTISVFMPKCTSDNVFFKKTFDFAGDFSILLNWWFEGCVVQFSRVPVFKIVVKK